MPTVTQISDGLCGLGVPGPLSQFMVDTFVLNADGDDILVTATGSTTARTLANRFADVLNVKDFGADPTGVADSTTAFNAVTEALRDSIELSGSNYYYATKAIYVPPGNYSVSSWDLTELLARNVHIIAPGAVITGNTADVAVVDAIGSRWLHFHGLTIRGLSTAVPSFGLQIGPKGTEACGNNKFYNVEILGYFDNAPFGNLGSETTEFYSCSFVNYLVAGLYAFIGDGATRFVPESEYATITRTLGTALSFSNNTHIGSQCRNEGGGDAVFLANAHGHTFNRGCYYLTFNAAAFRLYQTNAIRCQDLTIGGLFESDTADYPTPGNVGIRYAFVFDAADGTNTAIDGFVLDTFKPHVETALFDIETTGTVRLSNAVLKVESLLNAGAEWFDDALLLSIDGEIWTREAAKLNLDDIAKFNGTLRLNAVADFVRPVAGLWEAWFSTDSGYACNNDSILVLAQSNVGVPHTGDTAETVLATVTIPGGMMGTNGCLEISSIWTVTSSGNSKTARARLGGIAGAGVGTVVWTTNTSAVVTTRIGNRNSASSQIAATFGTRQTDVVMASVNSVTVAVDTASNQDLVLTGQCANSGDTITLESYTVKLTNESGAIA